jgi:hypothetical protein
MSRFFLRTAALAATLVSLDAAADEGRIPLFQVGPISEPGGYVLTRNIDASATDVIRVLSDGVTVDLNGHTITLDGTGTGVLIGPAVQQVTIRGGRIVGAAHGIAYTASTTRARIQIENVEIVAPTSYGIYVRGAQSLDVRGTRIASAVYDGIYADGVSAGFTGRFSDNQIDGCGRYGISLNGLQGGEVRRNSVSGCAGASLLLSSEAGWAAGGTLVDGNTLRGAGGTSLGIEVGVNSPNNLLQHNVVTAHGSHGILVASSGNRVAGNEVGGNGGDGLRADGGYNLFERNVSSGNLYGIRIPCNGSRYRDNMLMGNTTLYCTGSCCSTGNAGGNLQ